MHPARCAIAIAAGVVSCGTGAVAQRPTRDTAQQIAPVRITAGVAPRVTGGASAVLVRPDSLPLLGSAPVLAEVVRRLPFVYIRQNSRGENEISVRGSESRQAAVFVEGVPMTLTWDARTDPTIIPLTGAQRVEYVRGLSSLLAGPNAIGGTISVSLWDDVRGRPSPRTQRIDLQADQVGSLRTSALLGGTLAEGRRGTLSFRTGASWRTTPGIVRPRGVAEPAFDDALRLNSDGRSVDGFGGVRFDAPGGQYVSGLVSAMTGARGVMPELHLAQPRLWRNPSLSRVVASVAAGTGEIRSRLGTGDVELALGMNTGDVQIDVYPTTRFERPTDRELGEDRALTARLVADQTLGRYLTWRGAGTLARVRYDETLGLNIPVRAAYAQSLGSLATELELSPTRFFSLVGGVAEDAARTTDAGGRTAQGRQRGTGWRSGATWVLPMSGLRLHASSSARTRFPALRELYSGALNRFAPNPALRPERFTGSEVGATLQRDGWDMQLVGFTQRTTDAVVRITLPDRRFQRVNRDEFRSRGIEWLGGVAMGRATVRADLTWQDATIRDRIANSAEREPENLPSIFGSLTTTAPVWRELVGTARVRHVGATSCLGVQPNTRLTQRAATALDVGVERQWQSLPGFTSRMRALLMLDNAFDAAVYDQCGLPQPGRTVRIGVTFGG